MTFPIAIIAGGLGTRLHPITLNTPKSLIEINNRPFIYWQLKLLAERGVESVVLCLGHKAAEIVEFVGNGERYGLSIKYSIEDSQLGTAGAIKKAGHLLGEVFGVLYGDSYLPIDFLQVFSEYLVCNKDVLMTIYKNKNQHDVSNVALGLDGSLYYSKRCPLPEMKYIDYGFSVMNSKVLQSISWNTKSDLSELLESLSKMNQIEPFEVRDRFYEIGSNGGIVELENYLKEQEK